YLRQPGRIVIVDKVTGSVAGDGLADAVSVTVIDDTDVPALDQAVFEVVAVALAIEFQVAIGIVDAGGNPVVCVVRERPRRNGGVGGGQAQAVSYRIVGVTDRAIVARRIAAQIFARQPVETIISIVGPASAQFGDGEMIADRPER